VLEKMFCWVSCSCLLSLFLVKKRAFRRERPGFWEIDMIIKRKSENIGHKSTCMKKDEYVKGKTWTSSFFLCVRSCRPNANLTTIITLLHVQIS
jgi:hypothetical protein